MNQIKLSKVLRAAFTSGLTYEEYFEMNTIMAKQGRSSGMLKPSYIEYTKLSAARMRRWNKVYEPSPSFLNKIKLKTQLGEMWLVFGETWCGDVAHNLPFIAKWAAFLGIDLRVILRDENSDLMEEFLTNGCRSIPKLVRLNHEFNVLGSWGPRPSLLMKAHAEWNRQPEFDKKEWFLFAQDWYNKDKGVTLEMDFEALMD